jgi:hypothetical protein
MESLFLHPAVAIAWRWPDSFSVYRVFSSQWSDRGRGPRHVTRFLSRRLRGHRPRLERQLHDSRGTITMFSSLFLLFWSEVTDHAGLERWSASPAGRNVPGKLLGFVLYPQGEGYHLVHHLHPGIPANGLAEAHAKLLSFTIYREKDKLLSLCRTWPSKYGSRLCLLGSERAATDFPGLTQWPDPKV